MEQSDMRKDGAQEILLEHGFAQDPDASFGDLYYLPIDEKWRIVAYGSFRGNMFAGRIPEDYQHYDRVDIHLEQGGQDHRVFTVPALDRSIDRIIAALRQDAAHPKRITCPKCGRRLLAPRARRRGTGEFMSCTGWDEKSGQTSHGRGCNGSSQTEPNIDHR